MLIPIYVPPTWMYLYHFVWNFDVEIKIIFKKSISWRMHTCLVFQESVVVIGAGAAGLAAARHLHDNGYQVCLYSYDLQ